MGSVYASQAESWGGRNGCPGFVSLNGMREDTDNREARLEGKAAHQLAELRLKGKEAAHLVGLSNEEDVRYTQEMVDGADLAYRTVRDLLPSYSWVEERAPIKLVDGHRIGVRVDWTGIVGKDLHIMDFKFGRRDVSAFRNKQLILGAEGVCKWLQFRPHNIHLWIVQPRSYSKEGPVKHYVHTRQENLDIAGGLYQDAANALSPEPRFNPGPTCANCGGAAGCQALKRRTEEIMILIKTGVYEELSPLELSRALDEARKNLSILNARESALAAQAKDYIIAGKIVPTFYMEQGKNVRLWKTEGTPAVLEMLHGVKLSKLTYLTPAQAEEAGLDKSVVASNTNKVPGAAVLKQRDDEYITRQNEKAFKS